MSLFNLRLKIDWNSLNTYCQRSQTVYYTDLRDSPVNGKHAPPFHHGSPPDDQVIANFPYFFLIDHFFYLGFKEHMLIASKGLKFFPFLVLTAEKGFLEVEKVQITLVDSKTLMTPEFGRCTLCDGVPLMNSRRGPLADGVGGSICLTEKMEDGSLILCDFRIGCLSGKLGHNCFFRVKATIVTKDSPLYGQSVYSLPIIVESKNPAKNPRRYTGPPIPVDKPQDPPPQPIISTMTTSPLPSIPDSPIITIPSYEEEISQFLNDNGLGDLIPIFQLWDINLVTLLQSSRDQLMDLGVIDPIALDKLEQAIIIHNLLTPDFLF